jgi:hypothetical protein
MTTMRVSSVVLLVSLFAASSAAEYYLEDTAFVEVGYVGTGPGIPVEGEGIAVGGFAGALLQFTDSDYVLHVRPAAIYYRTVDGWGDDQRQFNIAGLSMSLALGLPDLGRILPYVDVGIDVVGAWSMAPYEIWDWGIGLHASVGAMFVLGDMFTIRPGVGFNSFLFTDLEQPMGGLFATLAFGIDTEPPDSGDGSVDQPEDFWIESSTIYPGAGQPGGAYVYVRRASGFEEPVNIWAEAPPGIVAVPLPDTTSGPDTWRVLVHAPPELCSEFSLTVHGSGGGVEKTTTVWVAPSCGTGGAQ